MHKNLDHSRCLGASHQVLDGIQCPNLGRQRVLDDKIESLAHSVSSNGCHKTQISCSFLGNDLLVVDVLHYPPWSTYRS